MSTTVAHAGTSHSTEPSASPDTPSLNQYWWLLVILAAHLPFVVAQLLNLWKRPHYQYFPVALLAIGCLVWTRLQPLPAEVNLKPHRWLAGALFVCALGLLASASGLDSPWIGTVAFILSAGGCLLHISRHFYLQNRFGIWVLLWLLVPLPGNYDVRLSQWLQRVTTVVSGLLLDLMGIVNYVEGTIISLSSKQLFVEEACSGIVSLMAIVACCLILAVWTNRPLIHTIILTASGIVWAGIMNILRIVTLAIAQEKLAVDLSGGWQHDVLGLVLFTFTILMTASTDRLLTFFFAPMPVGDKYQGRKNWLVRLWNGMFRFGLPRSLDRMLQRSRGAATPAPATGRVWAMTWVAAFGVMGFVSLFFGLSRASANRPLRNADLAEVLNEASLPPQLGEWQRVSYEQTTADPAFGSVKSKVWAYESPDGHRAMFSVDYVFRSWHDLRLCYASVGWSPDGASKVRHPSRPGDAKYLEALFFKDDVENGLLCFSLTQYDGQAFDPPQEVPLREELLRRIDQGSEELYQIQLWMPDTRSLSSRDREQARRLFEELRGVVVAQLFPNRPAGPQEPVSSTGT